MNEACEHLESIDLGPMPAGGCSPCIELGDTWVHLRYCVTCGMTACCEDSKNQHAKKHAESTAHNVVRSKEPGDNWAWCYADEMAIRTPVEAFVIVPA